MHPALLLVHPALKWKRLLYHCQIYLKTLHPAPSRFFFFFFCAVSSSFRCDQTSSSSARFCNLKWTIAAGGLCSFSCFNFPKILKCCILIFDLTGRCSFCSLCYLNLGSRQLCFFYYG